MTNGADAMDPRIWRVIGRAPLRPATGRGPLDGLRVAVRDLFAVRGQRIGAGSPDWLAAAVEPAVACLLAAGADVTGIAHTDEFALLGLLPEVTGNR